MSSPSLKFTNRGSVTVEIEGKTYDVNVTDFTVYAKLQRIQQLSKELASPKNKDFSNTIDMAQSQMDDVIRIMLDVEPETVIGTKGFNLCRYMELTAFLVDIMEANGIKEISNVAENISIRRLQRD